MLNREDKERIARERAERTKELASEVKAGTYVDHRADMQESWYPKRGTIKKDKKEMARIYGANT